MIEGVPDGFTPTTSTLQAYMVATRVTPTGSVHFNQSILNQIQTAVQTTQQSNLHSHPEDCPQRERHGWMADSQLSSAEATLNFDMVSGSQFARRV